MKTLPSFTLLLVAALLPAAEPPAGETPAGKPQVQRPQRERVNAANANNGDATRGTRQTERPQITPGISGWVYIAPQGSQDGPVPPKPDFTPGQGSPESPKVNRGNQPQGNSEANGQRNRSPLTPDEQHKLQTAMERINEDATVKEAREVLLKARRNLEEAARKERTQTEDAALKADPSLGPIFEKMRQAMNNANQPRQGEQAPNRPEGQPR